MTESASILLSGESTGCSSDVSSPEPPPLPLCPPPEFIDLVSSSSSSTGDDSSLSEESVTPPKAPPRIHRSPHKSCRGQEVESTVKQTEVTTSLTSTSEVSPFKLTLTPIKNDTIQRSSNSNNNNNNSICHQELKSGSHRQRHPALLLQPLKTEKFSNLTKVSHVKQLSCPVTITPVQMNSFKPMISSQHASQQRLMPPSSFWTSDRLPSGSEFDTTRLSAYINNFNNVRNSFINQTRPTSRHLKRHSRSKSVDRIHGVKGQLPTLVISQDMKYLVNINNHRKVHQHHFPGSLVQDQKNNLSKLVSSLKATAINAANRALIIPRTQDSLNSSDPDSGSTSGDNDNEVSPSSSSGVKLPHLVNRSLEPAKSALKKTVSSSSNSTLASPPVKNVTFSAFATVQMVDE